jgi:endonuclease YncB( thermonuclease family)
VAELANIPACYLNHTMPMRTSSNFCLHLVAFFISFLLPSLCLAWSGKVVSVTDGDTIKVMHLGKEVKVLLYGIDTPEKGQDFG